MSSIIYSELKEEEKDNIASVYSQGALVPKIV